jgi:hypothetical protein
MTREQLILSAQDVSEQQQLKKKRTGGCRCVAVNVHALQLGGAEFEN